MPEKQFLITESQLQEILSLAKSSDIFAEEIILEDQTVLDVFIGDTGRYSFQQGVSFTE